MLESILKSIFSAGTFQQMLRSATPVALAALGGLAHRRDLIEAYRAAGGRQTDQLDWYVALACFKLGIVIEGTWSRYLAGRASRDAGEQLHASAENLLTLGTRVAKGDNPFS